MKRRGPWCRRLSKFRTIISAKGLAEVGLVNHGDLPELLKVEANFSTKLTPEVLRQIKSASMDDPIFRQYVPYTDELNFRSDELSDPIGDKINSPLKGIIHRYPDRLLLTPTHTCAVYCRFCFRRENVGKAEAGLNKSELGAALAYVAAHTEVREVILSGGDPLILSDRRIGDIMQRLAAINHIEVIRIHTRVPMVEPERITPALLKTLRVRPAVFVVLHVNHVAELSVPVKKAIARMARAGIPLLSQSVLLKGVNDSAEVLEDLFRALIANRVKPYYLHQLDKAQGTSHFRVSIKCGQEIMRTLRGRLSGIAQPTYVLDIAGGHGKVPIGPTYLSENEIADPKGRRHVYSEK